MAEITVPLDTIHFMIVTARAYEASVPDTDPDSGSNPVDDDARDVLEAGEAEPFAAELAGTLDDLTPEQVADLLALMWVGRGDFAAEQWDEARVEAREAPNRRGARATLLGTDLLGDFLEEGLDALGLDTQTAEDEEM